MKHKLLAGALLATILSANAAGRLSTPAEFRQTLGNQLPYSVVGAPGGQQVLLIGAIDESMSKAFREILAADPGIRTVMVDSYGGNIESAMDIAALIRQRKLRLVVDGRCLSACANYLFPAAVSKLVLPGSVVAIHGLSTLYYEGGKAKWATESQTKDLFRSASWATDREAFQQRLRHQSLFYQQIGLHPDAHASFARYLAHRKQLFGTDMIDGAQWAFDCPPARMWALDQRQWEAMGVTGIESYWYPSGTEQQRQLLRDLGMPADYFYYGAAAGIEQLCQPSLMARITHWAAGPK